MAQMPNAKEFICEDQNRYRSQLVRYALDQIWRTDLDCVRDILGDAMHYCKAESIDFYEELSRAEKTFQEESAKP